MEMLTSLNLQLEVLVARGFDLSTDPTKLANKAESLISMFRAIEDQIQMAYPTIDEQTLNLNGFQDVLRAMMHMNLLIDGLYYLGLCDRQVPDYGDDGRILLSKHQQHINELIRFNRLERNATEDELEYFAQYQFELLNDVRGFEDLFNTKTQYAVYGALSILPPHASDDYVRV